MRRGALSRTPRGNPHKWKELSGKYLCVCCLWHFVCSCPWRSTAPVPRGLSPRGGAHIPVAGQLDKRTMVCCILLIWPAIRSIEIEVHTHIWWPLDGAMDHRPEEGCVRMGIFFLPLSTRACFCPNSPNNLEYVLAVSKNLAHPLHPVYDDGKGCLWKCRKWDFQDFACCCFCCWFNPLSQRGPKSDRKPIPDKPRNQEHLANHGLQQRMQFNAISESNS